MISVEERIKNVFDSIVPLPDDVSDDYCLEILGMDETDLDELQHEIEIEFDIDLDDDKYNIFVLTRGCYIELVDYIKRKIK